MTNGGISGNKVADWRQNWEIPCILQSIPAKPPPAPPGLGLPALPSLQGPLESPESSGGHEWMPGFRRRVLWSFSFPCKEEEEEEILMTSVLSSVLKDFTIF